MRDFKAELKELRRVNTNSYRRYRRLQGLPPHKRWIYPVTCTHCGAKGRAERNSKIDDKLEEEIRLLHACDVNIRDIKEWLEVEAAYKKGPPKEITIPYTGEDNG